MQTRAQQALRPKEAPRPQMSRASGAVLPQCWLAWILITPDTHHVRAGQLSRERQNRSSNQEQTVTLYLVSGGTMPAANHIAQDQFLYLFPLKKDAQ